MYSMDKVSDPFGLNLRGSGSVVRALCSSDCALCLRSISSDLNWRWHSRHATLPVVAKLCVSP